MLRFLKGSSVAFGFVLGLSVYPNWETISGRLLVRAASPQPTLQVHLHRFQIKTDKLEEFNRWVQFEHAHHAETLQTLGREKMYAEAIFRDSSRDPLSIYWLEIHGVGGAHVDTSPLAIDQTYETYMRETLVPHSRSTMDPEYVLIPDFIHAAIAQHEQAGNVRNSR